MSVRVRFAPSPTGPLHIGGVRTALYNYLFAKKHGGTFILRVEDTDRTRFVQGAEDYIVESLRWCGLECDEASHVGGEYGPYRQSERKDMYAKYATQLLDAGHAYYAFDTPTELDEMRERMKKQGNPSPQYNAISRQYMKNSLTLPKDEVEAKLAAGEPYVVRLKMPRQEEIKFEDEIRGWVQFHSSQLDDKVILKGDGMPTYHLANVVDDHLMKITHVIRGEEWLPSTPLHVILYRYLGWEETRPKFAHLPLILRPDGKGKLSKRDGDRLGIPVFPLDWENKATDDTASGFRERGFFPDAFVNMLAFLGWNPGTDEEMFAGQALIDAFDLKRVSKSGAKFDFDKASWFNQQYLKETPDAELAQMVRPLADAAGLAIDDAFLTTVCGLLKERVHFIPEFLEEGQYFFGKDFEYDPKTVAKKWKAERKPMFEGLKEDVAAIEEFTAGNVEVAVKGMMTSNELKFGDVLPVFRVMLCGTVAGPPIFDVAILLGQEETVARMNKFLDQH